MHSMDALREALLKAQGRPCRSAKTQPTGGDKDDVRVMCTNAAGGTDEQGKPIKKYANCPYAHSSWEEAKRSCKNYR